MFLPIRTDSPLRTTPYMNYGLIVMNVLIWVAQSVVARPEEGQPPWWRQYMLNSGAPEILTFITYGFLHAGAMHIIGNMLFLYIFGNNVNDKMGHVGYLAFYLGAIVFSGVTYAVLDNGTVLGASGAVSAVTGAYLILFPRARVTVLIIFFLIGTYEIPSLWFIIFFFAKDVIGLSGTSEVAHSAHVGGTVFGMLVCFGLLAVSLLPRDQFDIVALVKQWNRRRQYRDAVATGWNPYGGNAAAAGAPGPGAGPVRGWVQAPAAPAEPLDPKLQQAMELRSRISEAIAAHKLPEAANLYVQLKTLDPQNVLPRQSQLDVANQLASEQRYPQAAEAYETFLKAYPKYEQTDQLELMLGLILARFLKQPEKAREYLIRASAKLMDEGARNMARAELDKLGAPPAGGGTVTVSG